MYQLYVIVTEGKDHPFCIIGPPLSCQERMYVHLVYFDKEGAVKKVGHLGLEKVLQQYGKFKDDYQIVGVFDTLMECKIIMAVESQEKGDKAED